MANFALGFVWAALLGVSAHEEPDRDYDPALLADELVDVGDVVALGRGLQVLAFDQRRLGCLGFLHTLP